MKSQGYGGRDCKEWLSMKTGCHAIKVFNRVLSITLPWLAAVACSFAALSCYSSHDSVSLSSISELVTYYEDHDLKMSGDAKEDLWDTLTTLLEQDRIDEDKLGLLIQIAVKDSEKALRISVVDGLSTTVPSSTNFLRRCWNMDLLEGVDYYRFLRHNLVFYGGCRDYPGDETQIPEIALNWRTQIEVSKKQIWYDIRPVKIWKESESGDIPFAISGIYRPLPEEAGSVEISLNMDTAGSVEGVYLCDAILDIYQGPIADYKVSQRIDITAFTFKMPYHVAVQPMTSTNPK